MWEQPRDQRSKKSARRVLNRKRKLLRRFLNNCAEEMRAAPTPSEILLRSALLAAGVKFDFQKPIGRFIPDFVFQQWHGIAEVDGGYHFTKNQSEKDRRRDLMLRNYGFKVIRFSNDQVNADPRGVVTLITRVLPRWKMKKSTVDTGENSHMRSIRGEGP